MGQRKTTVNLGRRMKEKKRLDGSNDLLSGGAAVNSGVGRQIRQPVNVAEPKKWLKPKLTRV